MGELKARHVVDVYDNYAENPSEDYSQVYLKSEADVVIAEKDKEIAELKKSLEQKKIAEGSVCRILWNLVDSGIIKEWHFNGEYNVLLNADDPHIQISELKTKIDKVSLKFCKQLRHSNHKRCLAMANTLTWEHNYLVDFVSSDFPNVRFKRKHRIRWIKKWLELAEKFKEVK